jgi:hypothetical protein
VLCELAHLAAIRPASKHLRAWQKPPVISQSAARHPVTAVNPAHAVIVPPALAETEQTRFLVADRRHHSSHRRSRADAGNRRILSGDKQVGRIKSKI